MDEYPGGLMQRLAMEKQLLAEEKFLIKSLKCIVEEQHNLQVERLHLMSILHDLQKQVTPPTEQEQQAPAQAPSPPPPGLMADFNLASMDDDNLINEMDLNLTVPQHSFYEPLPEEQEDDDYEIEIGMLMNMKTNKK